MIADLKPYDTMRNSGVPWLGEVPENWDVRRLKYVLRERDTRSPDGVEQLLRVSQYTGVTPRKQEDGSDNPDTRAASLVGYKCVEPNELVVNIMLAWNGSMGVSKFTGIASPAYCVYRFAALVEPWYFHYLLRSPVYKARIKAVSTGVVESRLRLYTDDLYRLEVPLPPLSEQAAIVRFLDHADRRIRRYIGVKQKLIKLLEEQKQAIIHGAVTGGLDPSVCLKPLGSAPGFDVNERWRTARLWEVSRIRSEKNRADLPLLSVFLGRGVIPYGEGGGQVHKPSLDLDGYQVVYPGDLVLNNQQAWRGSVGVSKHHGIISPAYVVMQLTHTLDSRFADYLFQSRVMVSQFVTSSKGVGDIQRDIHTPWLKNARLAIPSIREQQAIATMLDHELADVARQVSLFEKESSILHEYRTRLVADVVTGRVDVRAAVATLPVETEEHSAFGDEVGIEDSVAEPYGERLDAELEKVEE